MTGELLGMSNILGRRVRIDPPASLTVGTYVKIKEALTAGDVDAASPLIDFFVEEARVVFDLYTQWRQDIRRYLDSKVAREQLDPEVRRIRELVAVAHPAMKSPREAAWAQICSNAAELMVLAGASQGRLEALHELRERWRTLHDSDVDFMMGLMDIVVRLLGEESLGEMYEKWVLGEWFHTRYARFDVSKTSWDEAFQLIVYLTFESMHGHLSGPDRDGSIAYEEFDDRVTFTFAPCGSGGRSVVGEPRDDLRPLMEEPFRYRVLEREHAFAWNKKGVCTYCVHCCVLTEKLPMQNFGYPIRVVDPPTYPNDGKAVCRWTVYRRVEDVPEAVYERLGLAKPAAGASLGSRGFAAKPAPREP
ncbi:MAG: hypothetical protein ACREU3_00320 [Steroidobacteraceae bacterium]